MNQLAMVLFTYKDGVAEINAGGIIVLVAIIAMVWGVLR